MSTSTSALSDDQPFIGLDIGGSCVKLVLVERIGYVPDASSGRIEHPLAAVIRDPSKSNYLGTEWGAKNAIRKLEWFGDSEHERAVYALWFLTSDFIEFAKRVKEDRELKPTPKARVSATGGGALRLRAEAEEMLGIELLIVDELKALTSGWRVDAESLAASEGPVEYPALVCNIGTGVSLVSVGAAHGEYERVSGSGIGGATFWGLVQRLTRFTSFGEAVTAAKLSGDPGQADTLVGDIYGVDTSKAIGMPADLVAGFLGKLGAGKATDADVVAALLRMVTSNLGQLAVFQARLMGVSEVWFTGGFVQCAGDKPEDSVGRIVRLALAEAVSFWSAGATRTRFPPDALLLGALGAVAASLNSLSQAM
ncbi:hypothetical protein IWW37_004207 [Coemansia sp. RSA 2050]|nr:hypothetical protein IWW37_004207 [Coemansia sp. RSA 2050]KAJ2731732.1 hypothetical protein IW152_004328 [Coemansia sp. BCRC 34962]